MLQGVKRVSRSLCEMHLSEAFRKASVESLSSACDESHRVRSFFLMEGGENGFRWCNLCGKMVLVSDKIAL